MKVRVCQRVRVAVSVVVLGGLGGSALAAMAGAPAGATTTAPAGPAVAWTPVPSATSLPKLTNAPMAYDAATGQVILYGGSNATSGAVSATTWAWKDTTWTRLTPQASPPPLTGASMAYDPASQEIVLFGGTGPTASTPTRGVAVPSSTTWAWKGTTWVKLTGSLATPAPRSSASMAYDAAAGELVLFGGLDFSNTTTPVYATTWAWKGTTWTELSSATNPSPAYNGAMAYDTATGQLVLFGGQTYGGTFQGTTWLWKDTAWSKGVPAASPPAETGPVAAYVPALGAVALFGGFTAAGGYQATTWLWQGSTWANVTPTVRPPARSGDAMVYDTAAKEAVLFGGFQTQLGALSTTWALTRAIVQVTPTVTVAPPAVTLGDETAQPFTVTVTGAPGDGSPEGAVSLAVTGAPVATACTPSPVHTSTARATFSCDLTSNDQLTAGGHTATATFTPTSGQSSSASGYAYLAATSAPAVPFEVDEAPAVTSPATASFPFGTSSTFTVTATGIPSPVLTESGALPYGLRFTAGPTGTATISGAPGLFALGTHRVTLTASNSAGSVTQTLTIVAGFAPTFVTPDRATFETGRPGVFFVGTLGYPFATLHVATGTLPKGLSFTTSGFGTATIAGTAATGSDGTYHVVLEATNGVATVTQDLAVTVETPDAHRWWTWWW